ncbi:DUF7619 domain-containing protein [Lacibacter sediminis]|uniref:T9SS type A sorting domain-containing protein n=1 Tax=Lacibacter sediminis TaxID=2760713 RepID=A0A7G5XCZ7_9BACT|nr:T9SS type A sorting domain-containing protein [Lacibacter sediminis]QNA43350.1 T9SS type A sorting domain-containing protein [Lacibacter sediminis]
MITFKKQLFFLLFLFCISFVAGQAQQRPFFGRTGKPVKRTTQNKPVFDARVTGTDSIGFGGEPGVVWERKLSELFPGGTDYYLTGNRQLVDGNFITSGLLSDSKDSLHNVFVKFSKDGNVLLKYIVPDEYSIYQFSVFPSLDSGWLTVRDRDSVINSFPQLVYRILSKYNKNGVKEWEQKIANGFSDYEQVIATEDKGYLVAYYLRDTILNLNCNNNYLRAQFHRIFLTKIDQSGNVQWRKSVFRQPGFFFTESSALNFVKVNTEFFIVGGFANMNADSSDCWNMANMDDDIFVAKIDSSGNELSFKKYGGSKDELLWYNAVIKNPKDFGIILVANTRSSNRDLSGVKTDTSYLDSWILKLDSAGVIKFNKVFDIYPNNDDYNIMGAQLNDTSYIMSTFGLVGNTDDNVISKVNSNGSIVWKRNISNGFVYELNLADQEIIYTKYLSEETEGFFGRLGTIASITGSVYYDFNKNNIKDTNEPYANKFLVTSEKTGYSRSSVSTNGWFRNDVDTGSYKTTVKLNNDYYVSVPAEKQTIFATLFQSDTVHFALQPVAGKRDLSISLIPLTPARPGFNAKYKLTFRNNGTDTVPNGGILLIKDPKVTLVSSAPAAGLVTGDSLLWMYAGLKPFDSYSVDIEVKLAAPPTLNNGDTLRYKAFINSTTGSAAAVDLTPLDDTVHLAQVVVGSYDPNDKQENVAGKIPLAKIVSGENIQYVVRFQNTGTDTAFTVRITDTLDAKLNWNSLQMINASHPYKMTVVDGNTISWTFPNINLPDSNVNEPLSHGYIAFRIKAKSNLTSGEYFQNKASIYFDYNLPVLTNTAVTVVSNALITNVRDFVNKDMQIVAMPNPSSGSLYLKLSGKLTGRFEYSVIDLYGRVFQTKSIERNNVQDSQLIPLQVNNLSAGVYYIVLRQKVKVWQQKIILH